MRAVLRPVFVSFTERFEGGVACLYNDIRGLTTIAYGDLCNTPGAAAALPLVHPDFTPASVSEKMAAWHAVHDDPKCAQLGWRYASTLSSLRLTPEGMAGIALMKLEENDIELAHRLPNWEDLPACAQLAMHSLAWACGAGANFPKLFSAVSAGDFDVASIEIHMNEYTPEGKKNSGLVPRNMANKILMRNAAYIRDAGLDPDLLPDLTLPLDRWDLTPKQVDTDPAIHVSPKYTDDDGPDEAA